MRIRDIDGYEHEINLKRFSYGTPKTTGVQLEFDDGDHVTVSAVEYTRIQMEIKNDIFK